MTSLWRQKRAEERDDAERSIGIEAEMLALRRKATLWGASEDQESITSFSERWEALSNWFPAPVVHQGVRYPTVEHAFQAAKAADDATAAAAIRKAESAKEAHALGQQVPLPAGWERSKLALMESLLRDKFRRDSALRERLLRTEQMNLIATNGWGETFWGVSAGKGSNALGKALMKLREEARTGTDVDEWLTSSFELVGPSDPCDGVKLEVYKSGALVDTLPLDGARAVFIVGKHSNCDVKLDHPSISRRHAAIIRDQSRGLLLVDLASKAGTTLAGRRAPPSTAVPLKDGSRSAFTRYCFTSKLHCGSQSSFYWSLPTCKAYPIAIAILLQTIAQYTPPPTDPPPLCHTPYNIGDGNIVKRPSSRCTPSTGRLERRPPVPRPRIAQELIISYKYTPERPPARNQETPCSDLNASLSLLTARNQETACSDVNAPLSLLTARNQETACSDLNAPLSLLTARNQETACSDLNAPLSLITARNQETACSDVNAPLSLLAGLCLAARRARTWCAWTRWTRSSFWRSSMRRWRRSSRSWRRTHRTRARSSGCCPPPSAGPTRPRPPSLWAT